MIPRHFIKVVISVVVLIIQDTVDGSVAFKIDNIQVAVEVRAVICVKVAILMGSVKDRDKMEPASAMLSELGIEHEVFVQTGSCYYYTEQQLFMAGTHPLVRVRPSVPMSYESEGWDFGWLMLRTDGHLMFRRCDPYTLAFNDAAGHYPIRWFVR